MLPNLSARVLKAFEDHYNQLIWGLWDSNIGTINTHAAPATTYLLRLAPCAMSAIVHVRNLRSHNICT